jgi:hypothetical protein
MAFSHPSIQSDNKKLTVVDAEKAGLCASTKLNITDDVRTERQTQNQRNPCQFLNIDAVPKAGVIWSM